ncbi:MAG: hypothetical protein Q8Q32_01315 [bacterium]|nr:hypothetical protein [bacterium]
MAAKKKAAAKQPEAEVTPEERSVRAWSVGLPFLLGAAMVVGIILLFGDYGSKKEETTAASTTEPDTAAAATESSASAGERLVMDRNGRVLAYQDIKSKPGHLHMMQEAYDPEFGIGRPVEMHSTRLEEESIEAPSSFPPPASMVDEEKEAMRARLAAAETLLRRASAADVGDAAVKADIDDFVEDGD